MLSNSEVPRKKSSLRKEKLKLDWFVYADRDEDGVWYYVGSGSLRRVNNPKRNGLHKKAMIKKGFRRIVLFATDDEEVAREVERYYVETLHTYINDPLAPPHAANLRNYG